MAKIVHSVEIARSPEDVFATLGDLSLLATGQGESDPVRVELGGERAGGAEGLAACQPWPVSVGRVGQQDRGCGEGRRRGPGQDEADYQAPRRAQLQLVVACRGWDDQRVRQRGSSCRPARAGRDPRA
jgi:hypothetical protein